MKQLRKPLAVLLAVFMLCTVLPLSGLVSAADNLIVNGDFESGSANWVLTNDSDTVTEVIDDPTGSGRGKVMHAVSTYNNSNGRDDMFYQQPTMEANTDYVLTFKVYCYSTASNAAFIVNFYDKDGGQKATYNTSDVTGLGCQNIDSSSAVRCRLNVNANTGKWVDVSIPFNSGNAVTSRILFSNYRVEQGYYYFDDVVLTKVGGDEPETPVEPDEPDLPDAPADYNMLKNGDFELGDANWTKLVSTIGVVADPTGAGQGKVMQTNEAGGSTHMFQQSVAMSANTDYVLTYKVYTYAASGTNPGWWVTVGDNSATYSTSAVVSNGIEVKTVDSSSSTRVRFTITNSALYNKWIEVKIPFNSGNNTAPNIMVSNYRANAGQYYFDDFVLVRADGKQEPGSDEPETPDTPDEPDQPVSESDVPGNMLVNGNFATGSLSGWENLYSRCTTSIVEGYNSTYGLQVTTPNAWDMVRQKVNVDTNTDYELSIWAKAGSSMTLLVKDGGDTTNVAQAALNSADWTKYTIKFNSGDYTSVYVSIMGGKAGASAIVDSAVLVKGSNNLLQNGDFETGNTTGWTNLYNACTLSMTGGHTGSYGLSFAGGQWNQTRQKVSVQANTNYVLTGWAKDASKVSFLVKDGGDTTNIAQISLGSSSEWTKYSVTFNTGDNTSIYVGMMVGGTSGSAIVDDISLEKEQVVVENLSTNGDFETGNLNGWTKYQSTAISAAAARNGNYGVSVKGPGDWGGTLDQQVSLVAGRTYQISFWYRAVSNGMNFVVRNADKVALSTSSYLNATIWTKYEATFVADSDTAFIHFNGSGKGTTDELYVDDVLLIDLSNSGNRAEVMTNGGSSIRDTADDNRGLAFRFTVAVNGAQVVNGNELVPNVGSIKLFKHNNVLGTLVGAGAIVTNVAAIGSSDMTHENVDNKKTIDVPVKYLLDLSEDSIGFAVRIINIPDHATETDIYARPYYTYELNGEQVTVYGDVVRNNYANVDATRRAVRVLTIGETDGFDSYLYGMLKDADYDQVILGSYVNGTYSKNDDNGQWVNTTCDADTVIADERWLVIVVTNDADLAWAEANKTESTAKVWLYDDALAIDTALANLATVLSANDAQQEYVASLTWFVTLTCESLDPIEYNAEFVGNDEYNMRRAAVHAYAAPDKVTNLKEVVLISGSDYQYYGSTADGLAVLKGLTDSLKNNTGYGAFDGLLFGGDYTITLGSDFDDSNAGLNLFDSVITDTVNFDKYYTQGNHDAAGIDLLSPYGNNDNPNAPYGVFILHEDKYDCYGNGGKKAAEDLTAYFNEKLANGWGNKPIFVTSHIPLHYNARTARDGMGFTAKYIVDALNAASEAGLNIIFLIGHNHGSGYDDYLGGAAVYVPKGETIMVPNHTNYRNAPIETELKFTYMNFGYISSYGTNGTGVDTALTMCAFRIQENGDVIITRYDKNGEHNLKSAGKANSIDESGYTFDDERVYESSRIVGANKDEEYNG